MKTFVLLNAIIFFIYGLGFIFLPEAFSVYATETFPATKPGMIDMRATYGGISLGFALFLAMMSRDSQLLPIGTKAGMLISGGMEFGRTVGILQDGAPNTLMYIYLVLEILVVIIGWRLLSKSNSF